MLCGVGRKITVQPPLQYDPASLWDRGQHHQLDTTAWARLIKPAQPPPATQRATDTVAMYLSQNLELCDEGRDLRVI